jgi:hypothetical protein
MVSFKTQHTIKKIKETLEKIFIFSIALLLIILFYPNHINKIIIDHETKQILCLFGVVIIIRELGFIF